MTTLTTVDAWDVIDIYITAWMTQDPDLIVTIFTPEASYHEKVLGEPMRGREAIGEYWRTKVAREQANIVCQPMTLLVAGDTAVVEWDVEFDDLVQGVRKHMMEIAMLRFEGGLISSLREYWASETIGQLAGERHP